MADLARRGEAEQLARRSLELMGRVDVLVNNAGSNRPQAVDAITDEAWDGLVELNLRFEDRTRRAFIDSMNAEVAVSASLAGFRGGAGMTAYSATKGAVIAFTTALALELAPDGIRVNAVCPGWVDTPFNGPAIAFMGGLEVQAKLLAAAVPLGRQAVPAEIAPLFVYLASEESSYVNGTTFLVDGGITAAYVTPE